MNAYTTAEIHAERRCAPLDRPPAAFRDGTRTPHARRAAKNIRAERAFKAQRYV